MWQIPSEHWCYNSSLWDARWPHWYFLVQSALVSHHCVEDTVISCSCMNMFLNIRLWRLLLGSSHSLVWATGNSVIDTKRAERTFCLGIGGMGVPLDWCSWAGPLANPGGLAPPFEIFGVGGKAWGWPFIPRAWQRHWRILDGKTKWPHFFKKLALVIPGSVLSLRFLICKTGDWDKLFHLAYPICTLYSRVSIPIPVTILHTLWCLHKLGYSLWSFYMWSCPLNLGHFKPRPVLCPLSVQSRMQQGCRPPCEIIFTLR